MNAAPSIRRRYHFIRQWLQLGCLMLLPVSNTAEAAPQTFNTALPVAEGELLLRQQFFYARAQTDARPGEELERFGSLSVLAYGATADLTLFGVVPYVDTELDGQRLGNARVRRDASGVGDVQLFARYTAFKRDRRGSTLRLAPFLGVETPTGDDDERDRFGRLPRPLQPGSGSWDPFGGMVVSYQTLDYAIDGQLSYKANTRAEGFEFGDVFRFDAAYQYRLWPRQLGASVPGFVYGGIEMNLRYQGDDEAADRRAAGGGTTLLLAPALQYVSRRWVIETSVQLPVLQDRDRGALEEDYVVRAGFRVNF